METQIEKEGDSQRERERKTDWEKFCECVERVRVSAFATERSMFILGLRIHCDSWRKFITLMAFFF